MYCTNCGTQLDEGNKFCTNCGTATGNTPKPAPLNKAATAIKAFIAKAKSKVPVITAALTACFAFAKSIAAKVKKHKSPVLITAAAAVLVAVTIVIIVSVRSAGYGTLQTYKTIEVYYTGRVTEDEADKLMQYLAACGWDKGSNKSVQLNKTLKTYRFKMVVDPSLAKDSAWRETFAQMGLEISQHVLDGANVNLYLCNDKLKTLAKVPMSK